MYLSVPFTPNASNRLSMLRALYRRGCRCNSVLLGLCNLGIHRRNHTLKLDTRVDVIIHTQKSTHIVLTINLFSTEKEELICRGDSALGLSGKSRR